MSRQFMEEDIVDGGGVGEAGGSTSSSDQVHYLHNGTVRRKLIVLKPESTFTSDPDRRSHLNHSHSDGIGNLSASDKRLIYSPSDHGSHLARMSFFDHRLLPRKRSWFSMKNCTRKLCLCFVVSIVSVIFGAAVGVYFGFRILDAESVKVKEFRGAFRVISGDNYTQDLVDTFSGAFLSRSQLYKAKLDTMFVSSVLKKAYLGSEILAIDPGESEESDDVIVRFNIRMDSTKIDVDAGDVYLVLINEILKGQSRLLSGIEVDEDSIEVHERKSKFIQDRESYELSTIPIRKSQLGKKVKLVTFTHNDADDENILSTTAETIFPISHDDVSEVSKGNKVHQTHDDQVSSPTKSTKTETALGYDFGSKLLEAILSGTNVSPIPDKSHENAELNDDSNAYNSPPEKSQVQEVTIVPHEFDGYVATLPKMPASERTEASESDKREVSVNSRQPSETGSVQLPSVSVIVHQHDNFPEAKVKPESNGWFNEMNRTTTIASSTVSHPPRIVSITDLRGRTPARTTEMTPVRSARPYLRRTTKSRYNGYEQPAETQKETRRTQAFTGRMRTTQSPNLPQPSPVSSTSSPNDRYIEIRRNPTRVSRRPSFGEKSRATPESRSVTTTRSKLLRTAEFDNNVKSSTEETENPIGGKNVIERQNSEFVLPQIPNSETIASTLLPFLPLLSPDRQCVPPELDLCANIDKNLTGIPSISSVLSATGINVVPAFDFIQSVLESGCFEYAHYFVCQLLQPGCDKGKPVLPCRYFCENFLEKCRYLLPPELYLSLSCNILPEKHEAKCVSKPECIHELRSKGQNYLVCDGIVDCHDMSDETRCSWCTPGQFLCGGRKCIDKSLRCDGKPDCPNEADERNCLALANNGPEAKHAHPYLDEGFVFLNDKGAMGKICADTLLKSISKDRREVVLKNVGESACELLNYKKLKSSTTKYDVDEMGPYFHILNPLSWRVTFLEAPCKSKQVIHVSCSNFACGQRPSRTPEHMVRFLDSSKHAALVDHGDWPWHAALFSADIHVCDGTLVADQWILTSSACFQGVLSRQWSARIGIVRLESSAPFQQLRRIVGRMHSPVKGSDIVLVKLDRPVQLTDFVRPVCLPTLNNQFATGKRCVTLGWDLPKNQLRQVVVSITETEECLWRWPVGKLHVFCTAEPSGVLNDCQGEDQSGGPLLCEDNGTWFLTGVVNWRIGCGLAKQPRLYDSVSVNVNWIQTTIKNHQRSSMLDNDIVNM